VAKPANERKRDRLAEVLFNKTKAGFGSATAWRRRSYAKAREVKPANMYYVYILKCRDSRLYVGCTSDMEDRIERHRKGQIPATRDRLPVELNYYSAFNDKYKAYDFEKYLKSGSGRAFMRKHLI
jgi:predicted GIY-YIG superfamily endonuclease